LYRSRVAVVARDVVTGVARRRARPGRRRLRRRNRRRTFAGRHGTGIVRAGIGGAGFGAGKRFVRRPRGHRDPRERRRDRDRVALEGPGRERGRRDGRGHGQARRGELVDVRGTAGTGGRAVGRTRFGRTPVHGQRAVPGTVARRRERFLQILLHVRVGREKVSSAGYCFPDVCLRNVRHS